MPDPDKSTAASGAAGIRVSLDLPSGFIAASDRRFAMHLSGAFDRAAATRSSMVRRAFLTLCARLRAGSRSASTAPRRHSYALPRTHEARAETTHSELRQYVAHRAVNLALAQTSMQTRVRTVT